MKTTKQNILVLASTFPRWKNDTTPPFVFELEKKLAEEFTIHVLAPHFKNAKRYEILDGLKIHRFRYFWPEAWQKLCYEGGIIPNIKKNKLLLFQGFTLIFFELIQAILLIRKEKISVIHAHWIIPQGLVALILNLFFGKEILLTTWGGDMFAFKKRNQFLLWMYKQVIKRSKYVTTVNKVFVDELNALTKTNKAIYIPNGVNTDTFYPTKIKRNKNILFIGRLAEKKGISYLIDAVTQLNKTLFDQLLIIGEGPLRASLEKQVMKNKLEKKIRFLGSIPNSQLPDYYRENAVMVVPSITTESGDREGLPTVYLEAMACGCPLITTTIDGIEEIIQHKKNGLLVEQKNSHTLAKALAEVLTDQKLATQLSQNGIAVVKEKYSWRKVSREYSKLIQLMY